ncbi:MAG: GerMN domain-containing protein [candidate division SR1 bacterium]|nr:GerMN domain-containing protein [candidate division SR1 bacterium]
MKKLFWTSVFWIVVVFLFRSYVRLFNQTLGLQIAGWFGKANPVCLSTNSGAQISGLDTQLQAIQTQLNDITQKLSAAASTAPAQSSASPFATTTSTKIALYYFNQKEDSKLPPGQQINVDSLLPVYRMFPATDDLLRDSIAYLIQGALTPEEKTAGFTTEFPNATFRLLSTNINPDGVLTLEFTDVPGFTDGGSARMLLMANSIIKTAKQFSGVKKVVFMPETLFQP